MLNNSKNKLFVISIILLSAYLLFRLIDQSKIITIFPLDITNDISSYMAILFFLAKYGFYKTTTLWYNGYVILKTYAPAWYFFTLPIYLLTKNIQLSAYLSLILMYILSFIFILILGKTQELSKTKTFLLFLLFFVNPIAIGDFIRLGSLTEMFAWTFLIPLIALCLYYKSHKLSKSFLLFIPIYSILMLTHPPETILAQFLVLSLFLIKKPKEKLYIFLSALAGILITSFWWVNYIIASKELTLLTAPSTARLLSLNPAWLWTNIASFLIPIALWSVFYFYYKEYNSKKELLFYSPLLILSIFYFTRLITFIPLLKQINPDSYNLFFLFFTIFLFLKTPFSYKLKKLVPVIALLVSLAFISISLLHTPFFQIHTSLEKETLSIIPEIQGKYLILQGTKTSYARAYYSYAAIFYNKETPDGWSYREVPRDYDIELEKVYKYFDEQDCENFIATAKHLNTTEIISYNKGCDIAKKCNLKEKIKKEHVCLYKL